MWTEHAGRVGGTDRPASGSGTAHRSSESPQFARAVEQVDRLVESCQRQVVGSGEFVHLAVDIFLEYLRHEDPRDDVMVLVEYLLDWTRELSGLGLFADRVMVADLEQHLAWSLERPALKLRLDELLGRLERGLRAGDDDARTQLVELCRCGLDDVPRLVTLAEWVREILVLAHRHGVAPALAAAVRPTSPARIAGRDRFAGGPYLLALDLLGCMAADPLATVEQRRLAQDQLIDLSTYVGVAGDAALRLPAHRLDRGQRDDLLRAVGDRVDRWPVGRAGDLFGIDGMREVEVVRTVLWQAADCEHARS